MAVDASAEQNGDTNLDGLAFFTFNYGSDVVLSRCKSAVSAVRQQTDEWALEHRYSRASLASLRASPHLRTVVAGTGTEFFSQPFSDTLRALPGCGTTDDEGEPWGAVYVMRRLGEDVDRWSIATTVVGPPLYHGIEILPDDDTLLVATAEWVSVRIGRGEARVRGAPFRIEQYSLAEIAPIPAGPDRPGSHRFGQRRRQLELPRPAVALMLSGEGTRVYALTRALQDPFNPTAPAALALHILDPIQMVEVSPPILLPDWVGTFGEHYLPLMALHPDGRTVATTAGMQPKFNVADLASGTAQAIAVDDADAVMDVAFSHGTHNHGMLAINVRKVMDAAERRLVPGASVKSQVRVGTLAGGAFVGFLAGLLGIGGGVIHVPLLVRALGVPTHVATATSHFVLAIMAGTASVTHVLAGSFGGGHGVYRALVLAVSLALGAQAGARLSGRVSARLIERMLTVALVLLAVRLGWTAVGPA